MPLLNTITTPYAEAFLQVAESRNEVDQVVEESKSLLDLWRESSEFSDAMASPVIEVQTKKDILEKIFSKKCSLIRRNFFDSIKSKEFVFLSTMSLQ